MTDPERVTLTEAERANDALRYKAAAEQPGGDA